MSDDTYDNGYKDGYSDGYEKGQDDVGEDLDKLKISIRSLIKDLQNTIGDIEYEVS